MIPAFIVPRECQAERLSNGLLQRQRCVRAIRRDQACHPSAKRGGRQSSALRNDRKRGWPWNDNRQLPGAIEPQQLLDIPRSESVVKETEASAQCRCPAELKGQAHSRIEIIMIADIGLILIPDAKRQIEFLGHFPIVLNEACEFKLIDIQSRITRSSRKLQRRVGKVIRQI